MKNNDMKILGLFLIGVALLLGLMHLNDQGRYVPVFDQDTSQDFRLEMVRYDDEVIKGGLLDARLEVQNLGSDGSMFVECGVYDRSKDSGSWVPRSAQVTMLDEENNCQTGESFVNTAQVFLNENEKVNVDFKMKVPVDYGEDVVLYCGAFERCWSESQPETFQSSKLTREITTLPALVSDEESEDDGVISPDNEEVVVVDENNISGTNTKLREWMRENSVMFIGLVLLLMIIGGIFVYSEPKKKNELIRY